jgi:hypothetical protein
MIFTLLAATALGLVDLAAPLASIFAWVQNWHAYIWYF